MNTQVIFSPPEPFYVKTRIWPVFLPFSGCPQRCIYCAQNLQTGLEPAPLSEHYQGLKMSLDKALGTNQRPLELAFFGGTFTALPDKWIDAFLALGQSYRAKGLITRIRCSTRPDRLDHLTLKYLRQSGLDIVELGIQSFSDDTLRASQRGYTSLQAQQACQLVQEAHLNLGIQLLPGLPGQNTRSWLQDIQTTCKIRPDLVRIYPCLVLAGTPLAQMWYEGKYHPWTLDQTIKYLSRGVLKLWRHNIPVIRIGLPPEKKMLDSLLAGPWHPALGSMVRGHILFATLLIQAMALGKAAKKLISPKRFQGELWGYKQKYLQQYKKIGIDPQRVHYWDKPYFVLQTLS